MSHAELMKLLHHGLAEMHLPINSHMEKQLLRHIAFVAKWNRMFNLTAIRDLKGMVIRHLLDSLSIMPFVKGKTILDVGTGAGFPGIPLAIVFPNCQFTLIDNNSKKTRFLQQVIYRLHLTNVNVIHRQVECYDPGKIFDTVVCRAFSTLYEFVQLSQHLAKPNAQFLCMKGVYPLIEVQEIAPPFQISGVHSLKVPFLDAQRHVIEMTFLGR